MSKAIRNVQSSPVKSSTGLPSGQWTCVWEQDERVVREEDLWFEVSGTNLIGQGHDVDGKFVYCGLLHDAGAIALKKQYVSGDSDGETFVYLGRYDGEGAFSGVWHHEHLTYIRGPFDLRPVRAGGAE